MAKTDRRAEKMLMYLPVVLIPISPLDTFPLEIVKDN